MESQNGNYHENHSCLYYFCCGMYCCCCLSCFCLSMFVKYISNRNDEKTDDNDGKIRKDIIDDYGTVIVKKIKNLPLHIMNFNYKMTMNLSYVRQLNDIIKLLQNIKQIQFVHIDIIAKSEKVFFLIYTNKQVKQEFLSNHQD